MEISSTRLHSNLKLFAVSFVMLFTEIFLIRWISTEVRIFAYVNNLVLLACFLGIGTGCYFSKKKAHTLMSFAMLAMIALTVQKGVFDGVTDRLSSFNDSVIWFDIFKTNSLWPALGGTALTLVLFSMIFAVFVPMGQWLGALLDDHPNIIEAYSINIAASLAGLWAFSALSFFYTKPWLWFALSMAFLFTFIWRERFQVLLALAATAAVMLLFLTSGAGNRALWTPYQKLMAFHSASADGKSNGYLISVNNVGYMSVMDLSDKYFKENPGQGSLAQRDLSQYDIPYRFTRARDSALIVGAGAGNDAAGALRNQVRHVDAVELDPGVYRAGQRLHPERPYQDARVTAYIDDARSYFKKSKKKYDVISFGLLDAHTSNSSFNNIRLDHYVYTRESFQEAKERLNKGGVLSVIFCSKPWQHARIYGLLKEVFGQVPYAFSVATPNDRYGWGGSMFITGNDIPAIQERVEADPALKAFIQEHRLQDTDPTGAVLTTDDWPYLYIPKRQIPRMYLAVILAVLALCLGASRLIGIGRKAGVHWHFFFLGAAFLLLEFQNVSKAALLFGSTWVTNTYIFSSILALILMANLAFHIFKPKNFKALYLLLLGSVALSYFIQPEMFNGLSFALKSTLAVSVQNLPIFFAGMIFIGSLERTAAKDIAFGSNLLGAAIGGVLESLSFVTGIKALLILVLVFYAISWFFLNRRVDAKGLA